MRINLQMYKLNFIKKRINQNIDDDTLFRIMFDMNRFFDKQFVIELQKYQKANNIKFNQTQRNIVRKYFYYGKEEFLDNINIAFPKLIYSEDDIDIVINDFFDRIQNYDSNKIISSLLERYKNLQNNNIPDNSSLWLQYYDKKRSRLFEFSLFILRIDQNDFQTHDYCLDYYEHVINDIYNKLENYRHLIIIFDGKIVNGDDVDITWQLIYKLGLYCENFIQFTDKFSPFKKDKSIKELVKFIEDRFSDYDCKDDVINFYKGISTGFKFEDCLISDNMDKVILTFKKIKLDTSPIPCPSCMTTIQNGNSFPELFLRSYECKNPNCPDRSKSGRGKRFDEFGTYRYFKLVEDYNSNKIDIDLYEKWRRDIFDHNNDVYFMLLKYYAWNNEIIKCYNCQFDNKTDRVIEYYKFIDTNAPIITFDQLPIVILMKKIKQHIKEPNKTETLNGSTIIINADSTKSMQKIKEGQIGSAITSPPYYNAREYSHWPTLICYLIDMILNADALYNVLCDEGHYLYNIGDIVSEDNIYVNSNMSKKRLQLGFLSCLLFEIVGFKVEGNIIWDKGQVQSKRNSTINLNSGYIKEINCYEHVLVLKKGNLLPHKSVSEIKRFNPVIKINSKGVNTYKHTAPYPQEMIELLKPFIINDKYVLDPFLGSGTTVKWCKENGYKSIGYELNKEYYELAKKRVYELTIFS